MKSLELLSVIMAIHMSNSLEVVYKSGSAARDLPETQGNCLNILPAVGINVSGTVVAWEFVAKKTGKTVLSLWDNLGQDRYRLYNKTYITVTSVGHQVFTIPENERYEARVGQVVGVHGMDAGGTDIIPRTTGDCCGLKTEPSHVQLVYDSNLPLGYTVTNNRVERRTNAILVHIKRGPIIKVTERDPRFPEGSIAGTFVQVPFFPPGIIRVHLDYLFPLPDLFVNVSVRDTGCDHVYVFWPLSAEEEGRGVLYRLCRLENRLDGEHTHCGFSCYSDFHNSERMKSTINIRILQPRGEAVSLHSLNMVNV